ncbi:MAG: hypothetical protein MUC83_05950, partial [Pirellula sp.]|nr:hypothetical protein [Pirellula sp.]
NASTARITTRSQIHIQIDQVQEFVTRPHYSDLSETSPAIHRRWLDLANVPGDTRDKPTPLFVELLPSLTRLTWLHKTAVL